MRNFAAIGLWAAALAGCTHLTIDVAGRPCADDDGCLEGYACHPKTARCVVAVVVSCAGDGLCPDDVNTGDPCPGEGAFLPCDAGFSNCDAGCRTCEADLSWSECSDPVCQVGRAQSCANCADNCLSGDRVIAAVCDTTGSVNACLVTGCTAGWSDLDGLATNGCETPCVPTVPAAEVCDGIDNDCDGTVDNEDTPGCAVYYRDRDQDGFGQVSDARCLCAPVADYNSTRQGDCADDPAGCGDECFPGGTEVCDTHDNDCNAIPDDGFNLTGCVDYYRDVDGDGFGPDGDTRCQCQPVSPYIVMSGGDCDDTLVGCNTACAPGLTEVCDGFDNDCNTIVDDAPPPACTVYYRDEDGDGWGVTSDSQCLCGPSGVYITQMSGDCEDDPMGCGMACQPMGTEVCDPNDYDEDCSGAGDNLDGLPSCEAYYRDDDRDGYGQTLDSRCLCDAVGVYDTKAPGDCDDNSLMCGDQCYPTNFEICDGQDNDCNNDGDAGCGLSLSTLDTSNSNLINDSVTALAVDQSGTLWVGTSGNGEASRLASGAMMFTDVAGLKAFPISDAVVNSDNNAWFSYVESGCTDIGMIGMGTACGTLPNCGPSLVDAVTRMPSHFCTDAMSTGTNQVNAMASHSANGLVWMGTFDDLGMCNPVVSVCSCDIDLGSPPNADAQAMELYGGLLVIGTSEAVTVVNLGATPCAVTGGATFVEYPDIFSGTGDDVEGVTLDIGDPGDGGVDDLFWFGSNGKGVVATPTSSMVAQANPGWLMLPSLNVRDVTMDNDKRHLFIATDAGIVMARLDDGAQSVFDDTNGLPSNDVRDLELDALNRILWIGTSAGVVRGTLEP